MEKTVMEVKKEALYLNDVKQLFRYIGIREECKNSAFLIAREYPSSVR
ncbi:MAG: hypothetical protein J7L47_09760 [Candidatus Odinarchaeota archaeon]|nr:hypothetical protein [Candidatus Odinarchaeota archaeon]